MLSKYFKRSEFTCKCGCGFCDVNPELINVLNDVRAHFNAPVIVTSGCRCESHNKSVGGGINSQHLLGNAADIKIVDVPARCVVHYLERKYPNIFGIGRYKAFTHIDVRPVRARWSFV